MLDHCRNWSCVSHSTVYMPFDISQGQRSPSLSLSLSFSLSLSLSPLSISLPLFISLRRPPRHTQTRCTDIYMDIEGRYMDIEGRFQVCIHPSQCSRVRTAHTDRLAIQVTARASRLRTSMCDGSMRREVMDLTRRRTGGHRDGQTERTRNPYTFVDSVHNIYPAQCAGITSTHDNKIFLGQRYSPFRVNPRPV